MRSFLIGVGLFICGLVSPVKAALVADSLQPHVKAPRFVFNFDARYTSVSNNSVRIGGVKAGIEWNNQFRTGLGYYALSSPVVTKFKAGPGQNTAQTELKLRYAAVYGEWVLLKNKNWEISLPLQLGFGKTHFSRYNSQNDLLLTEVRPLWLIEPTIAGHYKIFSWVGVGAGAGYRQGINFKQTQVQELNAPIYYLKAKVFVGELYRQVRQKHHFRANS